MANDEDLDRTPPSSPRSRASERAKSQKARNEEKVEADLKARMAAEIATLKAQLEKEKKRKEPSSSVEAANPKPRRPKVSNANTRKRQVVMFSLFDILLSHFNGCHFLDVLSVHRLSLMMLPMAAVPIL
jgi:hypothetical protein